MNQATPLPPLADVIAELPTWGNDTDKRKVRAVLRPLGLTLRDVCESPYLLPAEGEDGYEQLRNATYGYLSRSGQL